MSLHVHDPPPPQQWRVLWQLSGWGDSAGWWMYWIQRATLLCQRRSFNQVFYIHQLCPRSKQRLFTSGELRHPAGGGGGVAVQVLSNGKLAQAVAARTEKRLHLCVCLRDKQRWRDYRRLLLRKDRGRKVEDQV